MAPRGVLGGGVLVRNAAGRVITDTAALAARLVIVVALARAAGPSALGLVVLATTCASLALVPAVAGLDLWAAIEGAARSARANVVTARALRAVRFTAPATAAACLLGGAALGGRAAAAGLWAAALVLAAAPASVLQGGFAGADRLRLLARSGTAGALTAATVGLGAVHLGAGAAGALAGLAAGEAVAAGVSLALFRRHCGGLPRVREAPARVLRSALALAPTRPLSVALQRADVLLVGWLLGSAQVGLYGAATNLTLSVPLIAVAVSQAALPRLGRAPGGPDPALRGMVRVLAGAGAAAAATLLVAAPVIVETAYGAAYRTSAGVLRVLALALPLTFLSAGLGTAVLARGRPRWRAGALAAAVATNLAANLLLLPSVGLVGAAWATVAAESVHAALLVIALRRVGRAPTMVGRPLATIAPVGGAGRVATAPTNGSRH